MLYLLLQKESSDVVFFGNYLQGRMNTIDNKSSSLPKQIENHVYILSW